MKLKDDRGYLNRLITFTLLDYRHQFIEKMYIIDNKSQS